MELKTKIRVWWFAPLLVLLYLRLVPCVAQSANPTFHIARFEYDVNPPDCEDPKNPVEQMINTARLNKATPQELNSALALKYPADECAARFRAEIALALNVLGSLSDQRIGATIHLDKAKDLKPQLAKLRAPIDAVFLIQCAFALHPKNPNQLDVTCTVSRLNGDTIDGRDWSYPNPPIDKLAERLNDDVSDHIKHLCRNQMPIGVQGRR